MKNIFFFFISIFIIFSCSEKEDVYTPIAYNLEIPQLFKDKLIAPVIPFDNPLTIDGVALGKKLFFDTILSGNNSISCASCHKPNNSFAENSALSQGSLGGLGTRNSMPLFNLAWNFDAFFTWDGKFFNLENQAFDPVSNPVEMNGDWKKIAALLNTHNEYPTLFKKAFGVGDIDSTHVVKAIAQFQRTLISANSKFDRYLAGSETLTTQEQQGLDVFLREDKGDCFHCHGSPNNPLWTDNQFHNNGLDATFTDLGLGAVTGDPNDDGKFKTPSLRNLDFTAPFMHDGRFATLDDVINFYSEGLKNSPTIDPLMKKVNQGGVRLSAEDKAALKAFLLTLNDDTFIKNPKFVK